MNDTTSKAQHLLTYREERLQARRALVRRLVEEHESPDRPMQPSGKFPEGVKPLDPNIIAFPPPELHHLYR